MFEGQSQHCLVWGDNRVSRKPAGSSGPSEQPLSGYGLRWLSQGLILGFFKVSGETLAQSCALWETNLKRIHFSVCGQIHGLGSSWLKGSWLHLLWNRASEGIWEWAELKDRLLGGIPAIFLAQILDLSLYVSSPRRVSPEPTSCLLLGPRIASIRP